MSLSGAARIAGVVGDPIAHSLSPVIHNAWIAAAGLDAAYIPLRPGAAGFTALARALRGGVMAGLNVTAPFKPEALALADRASERARRAGSANLLLFDDAGAIIADSTDGEGLLAAFAEQAPLFDPKAAPVAVIGAGGAARAAIAAMLGAGAPEVRIINRSPEKAQALANALGSGVRALEAGEALSGAGAIINATPAAPEVPLSRAPERAVVMDMVYRPLLTPFLARARAAGLSTVDGLAMLIGQARPSFAALFGAPPPNVDVRVAALAAMAGRQ